MAIKINFNSLETRLITALLLLAAVPAIAIGWLAGNALFDAIKSERIREVGQVADAKHAQLVMVLTRANQRAENFLSDLSIQCGGSSVSINQVCATGLITSYLTSEGAIGATLSRKGSENINIGASATKNGEDIRFRAGQLAKFSETGPDSNRSYFVSVEDEPSGLQLIITYPSLVLEPVFNPPPQTLGISGETFLADGDGYFVTRARYPHAQGHDRPISANPMRTCLSGQSGEVLDLDYRDTEIIHGFRFIPELGSACIMAHIDQDEAFAPLKLLRQKIILVIFLFGTIIILTVIYLARRIVMPINSLKEVSRAIAAGDSSVQADITGVNEISELAASFNHMTNRLRDSRDELHRLLNSMDEGVYGVDIDGNCTFVNQSFLKMMGYRNENEVLGKNMHDLIHHSHSDGSPYMVSECKIYCAYLTNQTTSSDDEVFWRKDGVAVQVEYWSHPIVSNGMVTGSIVTFVDVTERKCGERALQAAKQHEAEALGELQVMMNTSGEGFWKVDKSGWIIEVNEAYCRIVGYARDEVVGTHVSKFEAVEQTPEAVTSHIQRIIDHGHDRFETRHRHHDGHLVDMEVITSFISESSCFIVLLHDVTARKRIEEALRVAAVTFEAQDGILITDAEAKILRVNKAFEDLSGYSAEELIGQNPRILKSGRHEADFYKAMWSDLIESGKWSGDIWDKRKSGVIYPKHMTITAVYDESHTVTHYVAVSNDISQRKQTEQEIHHLAFYDSLTNLPNRRMLMDRMKLAFAVSKRSGQHGALMFLDLDHFKTLNDTKGHEFGDLLLMEVAGRLISSLRDSDTVARLGGDEFVVVLGSLSAVADEAAAQAELVADKVRTALNRPYQLRDYTHHSTPSIGIVLFRGHQDSLDNLFKHADAAMYQAKAAGRNAIRFYDPAMQAAVEERSRMEDDLRLAIEKQQFRLHYQIQVDSLHRPLGAEVLLRWEHPEHGLLSPAQFIPLTEETGLIEQIGLWVLQTACAQLNDWQHDALTRDLVIAVNISPRQFHQANFVAQVKRVLLESGARPSHLKLELTESIVLKNIKDAIAKMHEIKLLGVSFSMDDFGTGYSSLQYLKRLPLDQIKIDQSFVLDITNDINDATIVQTIIAMTHALGLNVIAEGVETEAQLAFLKKYGCNAYQGYLFGKPLPLKQFEALLRDLQLSF